MFKILIPLFMVLWCSQSWAVTCHSHNPPVYTATFTKNITDPAQNKADQNFPDAYTWSLPGGSYDYCDCTGTVNSILYFTTQTDLPLGHSDGTLQYYKVNDNIEVATSVYHAGNVRKYINTPWSSLSDEYINPSPCSSVRIESGNAGKLTLYITKPFVGTSSFSKNVLRMYFNTSPSDPITTPSSYVNIAGTVIVPQNCVINAGQAITVDFGTLMSANFKTAGQKPTGTTDKTFNVPIKCTNIGASVNLTLRMTSTSVVAGNTDAIASDNKDVGVVVTTESGTVLKPNDTSSITGFSTDDSGNASVTLKAYPISTTGKAPAEGVFTSLACLVVDFA